MQCILETLTFGDILVVSSRKSHLTLEFRTFQMTSGLWYTKRSLRLWSVISQYFPVLENSKRVADSETGNVDSGTSEGMAGKCLAARAA